MKALISALAVGSSVSLHRPSLCRRDRSQDRSRLQEGWRHVGCCDQHVLREEDVSERFETSAMGRRLRSAPFFIRASGSHARSKSPAFAIELGPGAACVGASFYVPPYAEAR